jgi:hypothetical protein
MGFSQTNAKGKTYYLHNGPHKGMYFFSSKPAGSIALPNEMKVMENSRTGLPYVKKK